MEDLRMPVTKRTKINGTTNRLLLAVMILLLSITVPGFAQAPQQADSTHRMKVPETAKDHYEMAEHYQKIEAQTRQEIEMHQKMLTEFSQGVAKNPKDRNENPYIKNMRLHCEKYIKAAETLATEAAESARFHTLRAKELEGK
jgi:cell division protein FtsN